MPKPDALIHAKFLVGNRQVAAAISNKSDAHQYMPGYWWPVGSDCYIDASNVTMDERYNTTQWGCVGLYAVPPKLSQWLIGEQYTVLPLFDYPAAAKNFSVLDSYITIPGPAYIPVGTVGQLRVRLNETLLGWHSV